jgi:hypothetical protein
MLYKASVAVYSEVHTEHRSKTCEQNVEYLDVETGGKKE